MLSWLARVEAGASVAGVSLGLNRFLAVREMFISLTSPPANVSSGFEHHVGGTISLNSRGRPSVLVRSHLELQDPSFNRGYWADFEEFVRLLVVPKESSSGGSSAASGTSSVGPPFKDVYVITGPLFLPSLESKHAGGGDSEGEWWWRFSLVVY